MVAAVGCLVAVAIGAGLWFRSSREPGVVASELVPAPTQPTGPVPAESTAAEVGEPMVGQASTWTMARTGGDDRQLVLTFTRGGCGAYRIVATETADSVHAVPVPVPIPGKGICEAYSITDAVAGELAAPLGDRTLTGGGPGSQFVDGRELATLTWPPGTDRAAVEHLEGALEPGDFTWTQGFGPLGAARPIRHLVTLTQQRGGWQVDAGALAIGCESTATLDQRAVDIDGLPGVAVRCPNGSVAVWWKRGDDRLSLIVQPDAPLTEDDAVDLARQVRFGG